MWLTPEDAPRYRELTELLRVLLRDETAMHRQQRVTPEDLALYLEWLELAREAAPSLRPFIDKSSPFALDALSYGDLEHDFRWLGTQVECAAG